ncbi:ureidoglycolate lyase [Mesorhizobium loti]|uniref:Ureidoglycolate lyase n=1 Tax=Rhizobium loti TaxID=381 RepID=A0A8E3B1I8_RHILI|nr:fumarylacetoacetate hydrolase family protein [Mesorhizobium loti]PWJ84723.1 ureidoglycolate lyase [Mesorhizobium loti]
MKLLRYGEPGKEKPGLLDSDGNIRDISRHVADLSDDALSPASLCQLSRTDSDSFPIVSGSPRLGPPVGDVQRMICIGLNYSDHAEESGLPAPAEPVIFVKSCAATGPNDDVLIPLGGEKTDWEVELGVVIGRRVRHVEEKDALSYVAGYTIGHDVSERAFQHERGGQWTKGKSCEGFGPLGPWLVTADEVGDPQSLDIWLEVNGQRYQNGNTKNMIFSVAVIVSYLSKFMTLVPGDVILTGTPAGVGAGTKPTPKFLKAGDVVRLGIQRLGEQQQTFVPYT